MAQQAFFFDGSRCTGCKTCAFACSDRYDLEVGVAYRKVYECVGGETVPSGGGCFETTCFGYYVSIACNHCEDPVCVQVCPTEAMRKDGDTGLVSVDVKQCIGCGYCHLSCPYGAPKVDRSKGHSVKCDGCAERVASGEQPVCVEACPSRALDFGSLDDMAKLGERAAMAPLPDPSYTAPSLFVKMASDARHAGPEHVVIANPLEIK